MYDIIDCSLTFLNTSATRESAQDTGGPLPGYLDHQLPHQQFAVRRDEEHHI